MVLFDLVDRAGSDGHQKFLGQVAGEFVLDHVADIEHRGVLTGPDMGVSVRLVGVFDWHGEVGEGDHFGAEGFV